jgi:hypothetical protein
MGVHLGNEDIVPDTVLPGAGAIRAITYALFGQTLSKSCRRRAPAPIRASGSRKPAGLTKK